MKKCRILFALLLAGILLTCSAYGSESPSGEASGQDRRPALVKTVTEYAVDYDTGDWYPRAVTEYSYENGYPVSVVSTFPDAEIQTSVSLEYTFEDGQPVLMKRYDEEGVLEETVEYTDGKIARILEESPNGNSVTETLLSYANGDTYFTLLLFSRVSQGIQDEPGFNMEEVDSVSVTTSNGLLDKTVNTGLYANWNEGEEKEWLRFNGTYTAYYDEDGILTTTSSVFRAGPSGSIDLFETTWEDGRITEAVWSIQNPDQDAEPMARFEFEYYDDLEIDPVRYASMINAHIMGNEANYYRFYWY